MSVKLRAPLLRSILTGDKSCLFYWDPVEGADGYILEYRFADTEYKDNVQRLTTQHTHKNIQGLLNGCHYYCSIYAYTYEGNQQILGGKAGPIEFVPISQALSAPRTLCLSVGDSVTVEWDRRNRVPDVSFSSSDTSLVSVCQDGTITAYAEGSAQIYMKMNGSVEHTINVYVTRKLVRGHLRYTTILFAGEIMCPFSLQNHYRAHNYDFNEIFSPAIKELFSKADYVLGSLGTVCDDSSAYEGEELMLANLLPNKNAPSTFLESLKDCGFDALATSFKYNAIHGESGLTATRKKIRALGMKNIGTCGDNPVIQNINDMRIAFINLSLDGSYADHEIGDDTSSLLGRFSTDYFNELIQKAWDKKADQIIVLVYWGDENSRLLNEFQQNAARYIAESGADVIIGCGSHVLQAYEEITTADGRVVPCLYSLGNFYSNMRDMYDNSISTIASLTIGEDSASFSCRFTLIPTLVSHVDGLPVADTVFPVVTKAKQSASIYINSCYPDILLSQPISDTLSIQGTSNMKFLCEHLDCTFYYDTYNPSALAKEQGEYLAVELGGFLEYEDCILRLDKYIEKISKYYPGERIILISQKFSKWGASNGHIVKINNDDNQEQIARLANLENHFITAVQPIVIDISKFYFREMGGDNPLVYEVEYYEHLSRILRQISASRSLRFYYSSPDNELWLNHIIKYYDDIKSFPALSDALLNLTEAADILIQEEGPDFVETYSNQLIKLKDMHVELPYVHEFLKDDPDAAMLIYAADELWSQMEGCTL